MMKAVLALSMVVSSIVLTVPVCDMTVGLLLLLLAIVLLFLLSTLLNFGGPGAAAHGSLGNTWRICGSSRSRITNKDPRPSTLNYIQIHIYGNPPDELPTLILYIAYIYIYIYVLHIHIYIYIYIHIYI